MHILGKKSPSEGIRTAHPRVPKPLCSKCTAFRAVMVFAQMVPKD